MKTRGMKAALVAAAALAVCLSAGQAEAFWGHRQTVVTTNYALPSVPVTAGYAPVVMARPVLAAPVVAAPVVSAPVVTAGYAPIAAPVTGYYSPATIAPATTTYYAPSTVAAPVTSYYAPTTYYAPPAVAAPVTSYYAPTVVPSTTTTVITRRPWLLP